MSAEDDITTLEYRSRGDDRADVRRGSRRSRNAFFLLVMMANVFVGAVAGILTFCGVFFVVVSARQTTVTWSMLAYGGTIAVATLVLAYWTAGLIESD
jgi:hypothetical protein